ncbi:MAG: cobaltochelatase subunit CobT [Proteobacteria bacterium]|nr:cobaltochelatase subunit CobT [Pseudomonadota bacterium]
MDERLKESLSGAFRALSGDEKADVQFYSRLRMGPQSPLPDAHYFSDGHRVSVSASDGLAPEDLAILRGVMDGVALRAHHHDQKTHDKNRKDGSAGQLLDRLEQVRVEALGAEAMQGVADNIDARRRKEFTAHGYHAKENIKDMPIVEVSAMLLWHTLTGRPTQDFERAAMDSWGKILGRKIEEDLSGLKALTHDQQAFADAINRMVHKFGFADTAQANEQGEAPDAMTSNEQEKSEEEAEGEMPKQGESGASAPEAGAQPEAKALKKKELPTDAELQGAEEPGGGERPPASESAEFFPYRAFTTQFDRTVRARELVTPSELTQLRMQLDKRLALLTDITSRLAAKLQRKLMSRLMRSWKFHMEEGIIDAAKLTHIITDPSYSYVYKSEKEIEDPNTVVGLLIDNSGSMRGRPITVAALSADILARTLERCAIKTEVLGFTTTDWKGGKSRRLWMEKGGHANPGRLNDLLHIIYKKADEPWRMARKNLGLMLKEGLLKENIDGEALLWAAGRLAVRPEKRKILMVISDGAPVDDSTLSANAGDYLDYHLKQVIAEIEQAGEVELLAIGIGHDVNAYYRHAVTIRDVDQLGDTMIAELARLFEEGRERVPFRRRAS